ncbi:uncharacterized protein LOC114265323 [Camellia sinensis]|uniref:uncharacterized protein LOC114265323 n=1 Tax=Camellia sinensis TaxID=4442 RepID=UPI001036CF1A|nr:uncharacterized protein LOC114265323 [Camellia sinensis]
MGFRVSIVSNRDSRFTARLWLSLQIVMGTQLTLTTAYHPQTNGQSQCTIQILEDMLRACVLDFKGSLEKYLSLAEFAITIASKLVLGWHLLKPYTGILISPRKSLMRFGRSGKLSPRFIDLFYIIERVGEVAYHLALPPQLSGIQDVFHISMLRKYEPDPSHVLDWVNLEVDENVSYEKKPIKILDSREQVLRAKTIPLVKVLWHNHGVEEATWERETEVHEKYPDLFNDV